MNVKNSNKVGYRLKKWSKWILLLLILLTSFFAYNWKNIQFSYEFDDFLPVNDTESAFYTDYRSRFSSDNDFMLIAIENSPTVFDAHFLKEVERLTDELAEKSFVQYVTSLTNLNEIRIMPGGLVIEIPYLHLDSLRLDKDSTRIFSHSELVDQFIAKDAQSLCLLIKHDDFLSKEKCDSLLQLVEGTLSNYSFDKIRLTGRIKGQQYYVDTMQFETAFFVFLSVILIIIFLFIAFRSLWGILLPQIVLFGSLIWVIGAMGLLGEPINVLLVVLPSILFVVAMSDVIHMVSKYIDNLRAGMEKTEAIVNTMKEVGLATLLTSITTAIGFASLFLVNIKPVQSFGLFTALGVLLAFLLTFLVLPILFLYTKTPVVVRKEKLNSPIWTRFLSFAFGWTLRKRKWILSGFLIAGCFAFIGTSKIETNNFLMDDITDDVPIKQDFNYLDEHYGGVRPFELAFVLKDTSLSFWDKEVLHELEKVDNYLDSTYGVGRRNSILSAIRLMNRSASAGDASFYTIPESQRKITSYKRQLERFKGGELMRLFIDSTNTIARLQGTIPDWGNKIVTDKNVAFQEFVHATIDTTIVQPIVTGTPHLLDLNMRTLSVSIMEGLLLASAIVALIMGILYRSFIMVIIAIIPNLFPLLFVGGIMGYLGVDLKLMTAIVFTIAFGIAVDDTIHFLSKFKLELKKKKTVIWALRTTYVSTGKAIILTSLILSSGFLLLLFSSFQGTFTMGLLVSLSLFFAVIADLLLLPVLIVWWYRK
jgi:uncharacterized protein